MRLILIPGLGYDCRIFENLDLLDYDIEYLNWIEPKNKETINAYAQRLYSKINTSTEKTILIGHSLGGIVSQEIASIYPIDKIILISSIKSRKEIPQYFKIVKPLRLDKLFTKEVCVKTVKFWGKNHGFKTDEQKSLFKSMISKQTNHYLQWALKSLSTWREPKISSDTKIVHIHGTNDKTLPYGLVNQPNFTIKNGSHVCVINNSKEVSKIIRSII